MLRVLGVVVAAASYAVAQTADCSATGTTYEWSFNSLQQNPCTIAVYLGGACSMGEFRIQPLHPGELYLGPRKEVANLCRCSSVFYSLISVCALCQGRTFLRWSLYNTNCTNPNLGIFQPNIAAGTSVPHYAYLNVSISDNFDPDAARAVADAPESAGGSQMATGAPSTPSNNSSSGSGPKAGPIAGGVVGGVVFVALIIAATVFWWTRRRKANTAQSSQGITNYSDRGAPTPMSFSSGPTSVSPFVGMPSFSPKLYDPSDPSTYPSTPATSAVFTTQEHQPFIHPDAPSGGPYRTNTNPQGRNYTGAPEI